MHRPVECSHCVVRSHEQRVLASAQLQHAEVACRERAGKSTLAQQLASRLNLPNVLQTDIIYEARPQANPASSGQPGRPVHEITGLDVQREFALLVCMRYYISVHSVIIDCMKGCVGTPILPPQNVNLTCQQAWMLTAVPAQLLRGAEDSPLAGAPLWERGGLAPAALVSEFQRECRVVRKGVDGDLHKVRTGPSLPRSFAPPGAMEGLSSCVLSYCHLLHLQASRPSF